MLPIRLELKNFLPYRSPEPLIFDGVHLACLTGPNGAGKSSLLDAITWALWGKARASTDDLIHQGQQEMTVQLDFQHQGQLYRVIRTRARKRSSGSGTLDLLVRQDDGTWNTLTESGQRQTQTRITDLLRLDYETFINSAFLQQGKADAFTTRTAAERKKILADILGLDQWARYEDAVKEKLSDIAKEIAIHDALISEINADLQREPALRAEVTDAKQAEAEARAALETAETRLKEVDHAPGAMEQAQARQREVQRRIDTNQSDHNTVSAAIQRHEATITTHKATIALREEIEQGYAALEAAREMDRELGEKFRRLKGLDDQRLELEGQLKAERARLEGEITSLEQRIADSDQRIAQADPVRLEALQAELDTLRALESARDRLNEGDSQLREERAGLEEALKTLENTGKQLRERFEKLNATEGATCPLCGQPLSADHRDTLLGELDVDLANMREDYRRAKERSAEIVTTLDEHQVRLKSMNADLRRLSGLNEQAGSLRALAEDATAAADRKSADEDRLTGLRAALAADDFAPDIRQHIATIREQIGTLGYDQDSHDSAQQQLDTYRQYETQRMALQVAQEALPGVQASLEAETNRRERLDSALAADRQELTQIAQQIEQLKVLLNEYTEREQEANRCRTAANEAYRRVINAEQELGTMDSLRARRQQKEADRQAAQLERDIYDELRLAFSKNGIPAMIIETAIPELETAANDLLRRMTDGRMVLRFDTQREKKTGGMAETLEIQIADELGTRPYEMYSGGEAFRIDFAIRVALSELLARRAGAHLQTLFIDEGFGTQDAEGRSRLVEAITAIQEHFDLILVITHIDELRDSFPVHILVEKTASGSQVALR